MPPSRAGRIRRTALVVGAAASAIWLTLAITLPAVYAELSPDLSIGGWPSSSELRIREAKRALADGRPGYEAAGLRQLIRAVSADPLKASGFRDLGLVKDARGDRVQAQRLFTYAHWLSRRDASTELWMIEDRVRAGDVDGILAHYDHGLRTSRQLQPVLMPILVSASADPLVAEPLGRMLAKRPPWRIPFADQLVARFTNPETAIALLMQLRLDPEDQRQRADLVAAMSRLVALGAFEEAKVLSRQVAGESETETVVVVDGSFERRDGMPPFSWELVDQPALAAVAEPRDGAIGKMALSLVAESGRGGTVAKQLVLLEPGRYSLSGRAGQVAAGEGDRPSIVIACSNSASIPLRRIELAPSRSARLFRTQFTIPTECPAQWLSVVARSGTGDPPEETPWIDDLQIRPN